MSDTVDFVLKPATAALGAEIAGIDVFRLDAATFSALLEAVHRYSVVVVRGQRLSPEQQIAFGARFGNIGAMSMTQYAVEEHLELTVISNIKKDGKAIGIPDAGTLWHTDRSYLPCPDMYTILYGVEIPERDGKPLGDTCFASTAAAWDALSDELKDRLRDARAIHSHAHHFRMKENEGNFKRTLTQEQLTENPPVDHPVARLHPFTGRKCLFVTEGHTERIVGMPDDESRALLENLWRHIAQPQFVYRHMWKPGDVVIWDNCSTQHLAIQDYGDIPRRLHRCGIIGNATT